MLTARSSQPFSWMREQLLRNLLCQAMASGGYKKVEAEAMGSEGGEKPKAKAKAAAAAGKAAVKLTDMDEATINFAIDNWPPEKLRPEFLEKYNKVVATGLGVCSKCRCFNV